MGSSLWSALLAFSASGWCFYRVLAKKDKHTFSSGVSAGALLVLGIVELAPFLAKLTAKWLFST